MATLAKQPNVRRVPVKKREAEAEHKKRNSRVLLAVASLLTGLSIAAPAAVIVFIYPLNHAEFYYANGYWHGEIWWSYALTGIALSIGFGLAGIVLAILGEVSTHRRTPEGAGVKTAPSEATVARVALSLSLLDLILGPAAFVLFGVDAGTVVTIAFGLTGVVLAARGKTGAVEVQDAKTSSGWSTRAKLALALAMLILFLGPVVLRYLAAFTGIAVSIGLGVAGIVLASRGGKGTYRAAEGQDMKSPRLKVTPAKVAVSFALLVVILGPVAFLMTSMGGPEEHVAQWVELGFVGLGMVGIVVTIRPAATAASLILPFAVVTLMMGTWATIPIVSSNDSLGRILIGAGLVGIAVGVWGVSASDPALTRRWLLPFAIVAFALALLGDAHMFLMFGLQGLSL